MRPLVIVTAVALLVLSCGTPDPLPGHRAAAPDERNALFGVVREYYDLLGRAAVTGDLAPLYARHPKLARGEDRPRGVNTEAFTVQRTRAINIREVRVDIESYEPFRAFVKDDRAVAYSHGVFTWEYPQGSPTKGELFVRFDLARAGGWWEIERTDEWVLGEGPPPPTPR